MNGVLFWRFRAWFAQATLEMLALAGGLALAWWGDWRAKDFAWALYVFSTLCSFAALFWYALIVVVEQPPLQAARQCLQAHGWIKAAERGLIRGLTALAGTLLLGVFLGPAAWITGQFLAKFYPMVDVIGRQVVDLGDAWMLALGEYWVFVATMFFSAKQLFAIPPSILQALAENAAEEARLQGECEKVLAGTHPAIADPRIVGILAKRPQWPVGHFKWVLGLTLKEWENEQLASPLLAARPKPVLLEGIVTIHLNMLLLAIIILFMCAARSADRSGFALFAFVYAAYFFPWRLLIRPAPGEEV